MRRWEWWIGAGVVTAGISAALLAGAGVAGAETDTSTGGVSSSASDRDVESTSRQGVERTATEAEEGTGKPIRGGVDDDADRSAEPERQARMHRAEAAAARADETATARLTADTDSASRATKPVTAGPPQPRSVIGLVSAAVFDTLNAAERVVTGPPVVPRGSTVTVRSSNLQIADNTAVPADWYFPAGDEPPARMILLQHGFLATGPMYSHTAATLAERTNSIVVTPSLTSNVLAPGGLWLGGNAMHRAVADLFVGDRAALVASAISAGYADRYGLTLDTAVLPRRFALAGHSLGGALVAGTAGYLADNGAADDLVGVILLDAVPLGDQLSSALRKLDDHEARTGHFVPVREIGAPWNLWNSLSNVNRDLPGARPFRYAGVVLDGGVHMDAMLGGNPLIQLAAYLAAGFPQPQNPQAVTELSITWLEDWFDGRTDVGDDLVPGSTIVVPTSAGQARGVVIGDSSALRPIPVRARQLAA